MELKKNKIITWYSRRPTPAIDDPVVTCSEFLDGDWIDDCNGVEEG